MMPTPQKIRASVLHHHGEGDFTRLVLCQLPIDHCLPVLDPPPTYVHCRVNVGCCKPEALLGYRIKLKSIKGEGIVRGFSPQTLQHTVDFDGRKEQILLATEDVT